MLVSFCNFVFLRKQKTKKLPAFEVQYVCKKALLIYKRDTSIEVLWCKLCPRRLPRGFSYIIVGVVYHPPTADDEQMINYLINTLSEIEISIPNAAIILTGDFNRLLLC